jgi:hypothetical protein
VVGDARVGQVARLGHLVIRFPAHDGTFREGKHRGGATKGSLHSRNEAHIGRRKHF